MAVDAAFSTLTITETKTDLISEENTPTNNTSTNDNDNNKSNNDEFKVGDLVQLKVPSMVKGSSAGAKAHGPFKISQRISRRSFALEDPANPTKAHAIVETVRLAVYVEGECDPVGAGGVGALQTRGSPATGHQSQKRTASRSNVGNEGSAAKKSRSTTAVVKETPEEYEVESISESKIVRGKVKYLVKWVGYSDEESTWEPTSNLSHCPELIETFHKENPTMPTADDEVQKPVIKKSASVGRPKSAPVTVKRGRGRPPMAIGAARAGSKTKKPSKKKEEDDDDDTDYEVEEIVAKRGQKYQVKWKGYKALTWEPKSNLDGCDKLIAEFEEEQKNEEGYEVQEILDSKYQNGVLVYQVHWKGYPKSEATWEPLKNLSSATALVEEFKSKTDKKRR